MTTTPQRRKRPLTFEQHQAIGATLFVMRTQLLLISVWLGRTYHKDASRPVDWVWKRIDRFRSDMDDRIGLEFPTREAMDLNHTYYPGDGEGSRVPRVDRITTAEEVLTALFPMPSQLKAVENQLYKAYPVSLGDRLLPLTNRLMVLCHDIPDLIRSDLPKRCMGGMVCRNGMVVRSEIAHIDTLVHEVARRKAYLNELEVSCWYEDRVVQLPGRTFLERYGHQGKIGV
jgi:hypothetical protein